MTTLEKYFPSLCYTVIARYTHTEVFPLHCWSYNKSVWDFAFTEVVSTRLSPFLVFSADTGIAGLGLSWSLPCFAMCYHALAKSLRREGAACLWSHPWVWDTEGVPALQRHRC